VSSILYVLDLVGVLRPLVTMVGACAVIVIVVFFLKRS